MHQRTLREYKAAQKHSKTVPPKLKQLFYSNYLLKHLNLKALKNLKGKITSFNNLSFHNIQNSVQGLRSLVLKHPRAIACYLLLMTVAVISAMVIFLATKKAAHFQEQAIKTTTASFAAAASPASNALSTTSAPTSQIIASAPDSAASSALSTAALTNSVAAVASVAVTAPTLAEKVITVRGSSDNLNKIFKRLNLPSIAAKQILTLAKAQDLRTLRAGEKLTFAFAPDKQLAKIIYPISATDTLTVSRRGSEASSSNANNAPHFQAKIDHVEPTVRLEYTSLNIGNGSIYAAAKKAGMPRTLAAQFVSIFKNKVNLEKTLHAGDSVSFLYRDYYVNDKKIKSGEIVVAEYTRGTETSSAIAFTDSYGRTNYYSPDGYSFKAPFIRYPLQFKYVSSPFSLRRYHPIYHTYCAHTGVDLAAPYGTPIKASSDGVVTFAGPNNNYGYTIELKHDAKYGSLYAHLSKFAKGVQRGSHVQQGQVIGYVGNSGVTTGAHLHYEFHINNKPYDPVKVKLPSTELIASADRSKFMAQEKQLLGKLDVLKHTRSMIAASDGDGAQTSAHSTL